MSTEQWPLDLAAKRSLLTFMRTVSVMWRGQKPHSNGSSRKWEAVVDNTFTEFGGKRQENDRTVFGESVRIKGRFLRKGRHFSKY